MIKLLIATHNQGKLNEYAQLLSSTGIDLLSLDDIGVTEEVDETGVSFRENSYLKAKGYSVLRGRITLSDDSGLQVDHLGGEPGIYSARYGGELCDNDSDRVELLLNNLHGTPWHDRTARFTCVISICLGEELLSSVVGSISGMIQYEPRGHNGFGYDPIFYLPSYLKTMSELQQKEKNLLSHRADALRKVSAILPKLINGQR